MLLLPNGPGGAATTYNDQIDGRLCRVATNPSLDIGARDAAFSLRRSSVWTSEGSDSLPEHLLCASGMYEYSVSRILALWMRALCTATHAPFIVKRMSTCIAFTVPTVRTVP